MGFWHGFASQLAEEGGVLFREFYQAGFVSNLTDLGQNALMCRYDSSPQITHSV